MRPFPKTLTARAANQPQGKPRATPANTIRQLSNSTTGCCPPKAHRQMSKSEDTTISRSDFVSARDVKAKFYIGYAKSAAQITYLTKEEHAEACARLSSRHGVNRYEQ